ncbi:metallophosphoesterase [Ramlibacter tataouinensis]|uniref:metallophosphoesterase n=1 Tax=Ramlibacter tataouinensis TaxID=94132 RepID=UPI0022F3DA25|nr:metallophosphoesterase [Ramlibacter tataouinensis]WBX99987.1 metallophosphoesterase [Ramlibacter tataouinensis]
MKFQLASDLHLETQPEAQLRPAPGAELLVLAGDIGSYQAGSALPGDDFGLERFSPRLGWPVPVLFVPGNHEYDNLDFDETHARLRETCERLGITWLEREVVVIDGVRFVGTTLWSDFDALAAQAPDTGQALKQRDKAFRAADFYLAKAAARRRGQPMLAEGWRELGLECQQWLRQALAQPFDGPTVAVTHFAPSLRSADPRYGITPGTAGFCNALDELLPRAQLWVHGHLHCPQDYRVGSCRVVANPLGYARKGEQDGFRPDLVLEVPAAAAQPPAR